MSGRFETLLVNAETKKSKNNWTFWLTKHGTVRRIFDLWGPSLFAETTALLGGSSVLGFQKRALERGKENTPK